MRGHEGGVLSLSWCRQDSDLLLSCGKDNRTICWSTQTGEAYGEFPVVTNWTFQTRWNPHNPSIIATASFDGKIAVQTVQNTNSEGGQGGGTQSQNLDGEDFFAKAQSQPQSDSFSLRKAPKWLERPCGASFGFGGKVISFSFEETDGNGIRHSTVQVSNFAVDIEIGTMTDVFEKAMSEHDLKGICQTKISQANLETEKTDWKVIETLISDNPRKELIKYLGFSKYEDEASDELSKLTINGDAIDQSSERQVNKVKNNRLSAFFDASHEGDNFLADLAATKGAKTNNPFHIFSGSESESDRKITQALTLGQFSKAMEVCLREDRLSDAFMIAICGGQQCIDQVQKAYFTKQENGPNYLRLLASVVGKNLWDVVYNADLENWREVMTTLCTYASAEEFPDLCEALGDRLEEQLNHESNDISSLRTDASFCYIAGSKLEKVISLWISELERNEGSRLQDRNEDSTFSVHARTLQSFIEKVTVFREVTHYQDTESRAKSDWKLASLYEKYTEYAEIVASHGQLQIAEKYLELLPEQYPAAEIARNRVRQATQKAPSVAATRQTKNSANIPRFEDQSAPSAKFPKPPSNIYAPSGLNQSQEPYTPQTLGSYGAPTYQPTQPVQQAQRQQFGAAPPSMYGLPSQNQNLGPPPRNFNASPSIAPPSKAQNTSNWNDTPESFFKPPTSRRGTPGVNLSTINAPFPSQSNIPTSPMAGSQFGAQQRNTPPGPPPRGTGPPPRTMTPQTNESQIYQQPERPSSSAASTYAPQHSTNQLGISQQPPQIPRGPSPYNAPPPGPPPSNRYAPAPAPSAPITAPQSQRQAPPPNPYASQQNYTAPQSFLSSHYGPQPGSHAPPSQQSGPPPPPRSSTASTGPPQGQPQSSRPSSAQSQRTVPKYRRFLPAKNNKFKPLTNSIAPGDRSHIPSDAQPIFEILNNEMQRVKSKAPPSFKAQVNDTEKRINILFDHLNNEELLKPDTIESMVELAEAIRSRNYEQAQAIHIKVMTHKTDECGTWIVNTRILAVFILSY